MLIGRIGVKKIWQSLWGLNLFIEGFAYFGRVLGRGEGNFGSLPPPQSTCMTLTIIHCLTLPLKQRVPLIPALYKVYLIPGLCKVLIFPSLLNSCSVQCRD